MKDVIHIFSDGGSRGNPGPSACAFVVTDTKGNVLHKESIYLGEATNNIAEYKGLLNALQWIEKNYSPSLIKFYMDSELVIRQIKGEYKVKDGNLKTLYEEVIKIRKNLKSKIVFQHIPREKNKLADLLVNHELDKKT